MGLISLVWGIVALLWMVVAFVPLLGWGNWFLIPFAVIGAVIGGLGVLFTPKGNRGRAVAGLVINLVVLIIAQFRLGIGGGII